MSEFSRALFSLATTTNQPQLKIKLKLIKSRVYKRVLTKSTESLLLLKADSAVLVEVRDVGVHLGTRLALKPSVLDVPARVLGRRGQAVVARLYVLREVLARRVDARAVPAGHRWVSPGIK